jgi:hypothetical protein
LLWDAHIGERTAARHQFFVMLSWITACVCKLLQEPDVGIMGVGIMGVGIMGVGIMGVGIVGLRLLCHRLAACH